MEGSHRELGRIVVEHWTKDPRSPLAEGPYVFLGPEHPTPSYSFQGLAVQHLLVPNMHTYKRLRIM